MFNFTSNLKRVTTQVVNIFIFQKIYNPHAKNNNIILYYNGFIFLFLFNEVRYNTHIDTTSDLNNILSVRTHAPLK